MDRFIGKFLLSVYERILGTDIDKMNVNFGR
jgi:hypothetical protein